MKLPEWNSIMWLGKIWNRGVKRYWWPAEYSTWTMKRRFFIWTASQYGRVLYIADALSSACCAAARRWGWLWRKVNRRDFKDARTCDPTCWSVEQARRREGGVVGWIQKATYWSISLLKTRGVKYSPIRYVIPNRVIPWIFYQFLWLVLRSILLCFSRQSIVSQSNLNSMLSTLK